jgi:hypothetical protein
VSVTLKFNTNEEADRLFAEAVSALLKGTE